MPNFPPDQGWVYTMPIQQINPTIQPMYQLDEYPEPQPNVFEKVNMSERVEVPLKLVTRDEIGWVSNVLTDINEIFDPRKNPLLNMPMNSLGDQVDFWKEIFRFDDNCSFVFDQIGRMSPFAQRFIDAFQREIPRENWYVYALFDEIEYGSSHIHFYSPLGHTTETKSKTLTDVFKTSIKETKSYYDTHRHSNARSSQALRVGFFGFLMEYMRNSWNLGSSLSGIKKFKDIKKLVENQSNFKIKITLNKDAKGVYSWETGTVEMTLDYSNRSELYKLFEYSTNIINVVGEKDWTRGKGEYTLYGVELEVSTDYEPRSIVDSFSDIFAFCKKDSSITGTKQNKFEIVTIPASLREQRKNWLSFFKNLNDDNFDTMDKHNNGMHVHIGRNAFDQSSNHLKKFCWFFTNPSNSMLLTEISERDNKSIEQYSKMPKAKAVYEAERILSRGDKNTVVNLGKSATVEVRLFKGVVCLPSVIKNLEFVDSIVEFTKVTGLNNCNLRDYIKYLDCLPSTQWKFLRAALEKLNLKEMEVMAEFDELFAKANGPREAVTALNLKTIKGDLATKVQKIFNTKYQDTGNKLQYDTMTNGSIVFSILKEGTKFSSLDDRFRKMYRI